MNKTTEKKLKPDGMINKWIHRYSSPPKKPAPQIHILKLHSQYFPAVYDNIKTHEIRYNDRGYKVGDVLCLREYNDIVVYTGSVCWRTVTHIHSGLGLQDGCSGILNLAT